MNAVTVEFFGIPRLRAGRRELRVQGASALEALRAVEEACPALAGLCLPDGTLSPHFLLSRNGESFVKDMSEPVREGERLLLLSADAGG